MVCIEAEREELKKILPRPLFSLEVDVLSCMTLVGIAHTYMCPACAVEVSPSRTTCTNGGRVHSDSRALSKIPCTRRWKQWPAVASSAGPSGAPWHGDSVLDVPPLLPWLAPSLHPLLTKTEKEEDMETAEIELDTWAPSLAIRRLQRWTPPNPRVPKWKRNE